jgi:hypothetical protein
LAIRRIIAGPAIGVPAWGQDDPYVNGDPEWEELGGTDAEHRRRWRAQVRGAQGEVVLAAVRRSPSIAQPIRAGGGSEATAARDLRSAQGRGRETSAQQPVDESQILISMTDNAKVLRDVGMPARSGRRLAAGRLPATRVNRGPRHGLAVFPGVG